MATPATLVVFVAVFLLVAAGIASILAGRHQRSPFAGAATLRCNAPRCGHHNRPDARFCANCGAALRSSSVGNSPTQTPNGEP